VKEENKRRNKVHERIRRPIAALAVVWVLLAALGAGAATLVADDITGPRSAEQAGVGMVGSIPRSAEQTEGGRVGPVPDMAVSSRPVGAGEEQAGVTLAGTGLVGNILRAA
jgi:hypothetical protein